MEIHISGWCKKHLVHLDMQGYISNTCQIEDQGVNSSGIKYYKITFPWPKNTFYCHLGGDDCWEAWAIQVE